jgi:4-hydroxyphenylpyruvate dioxygenase
LFWEDLVYAAKRFDSAATETSEDPILQAAKWVRELCDKEGLEIFVLQPFMNYDGLLDPKAHDLMIKKLHLWFKIAKVLGTEMIQVPSQVLNFVYLEFTSFVVDLDFTFRCI